MPQLSVAVPPQQTKPPAANGSLEYRSLLSAEYGEARLSLWPEAGEATVAIIPWWCSLARKKRPPDPRSRAEHRRANGRRACRAVRLYVRANALRFMWTLTYRDAAADRAQVVRDVRQFLVRLQFQWGRLPVCYVIERGTKGTKRLHVHLAVPCWLDHTTMEWLWGQGFVHVGAHKRLRGEQRSRHLARYLCKYITKQIEQEAEDQPNERPDGRHRYGVTQGWAPVCVKRRFWTISDALAWIETHYLHAPEPRRWSVEGMPDIWGCTYVWEDAELAHWLTYT